MAASGKHRSPHANWGLLALVGIPLALYPQAAPSPPKDIEERRKLLSEIVWPLHEPLMFLRRRGGFDIDAERDYLRYHTEENVQKIAATGLEMSRTLHFYKGFGLAAEAEEMERTAELARLFHKYGLKVPVYIGGTMFSETFFLETPEAKDWVRTDQWGRPVTYMLHQSSRYFPCLNQPGYVEYLKRVLQKAVVDAGADRVFFDNFTLYPEPQSCHNEACVCEFRRFLVRKYGDAERTRRFGFPQVEGIHPPLWNVFNQPWQLKEIIDPLLQEWVDFRCWTIANYYRQLYDYIKSLNPAVSVGVNIKGIMGRNRAFRDGIDHARFAEIGDWLELDPGYAAGMAPTGALVSEIRSYKAGQSLAIPFDFEADTELRAAEYMAFNFQKETPGFGMNGGFRELIWMPHLFRYFDFFRKHDAAYYRHARSIADVAVLRSYATMSTSNLAVHRSVILAEQVLIQHHIPFQIMFDKHLADLSRYRVLLLADQECLSDEDLAKIRAYVERGGALVVGGRTGAFDQWRRIRSGGRLAQALGFAPGPASRGRLGQGRYICLPAIVPARQEPLPPEPPFPQAGWASAYRDFEPEEWLLPKNTSEIVAALRWAAAGPFSAEIEAPLTAVAEFTRISPGQFGLHLLNYDQSQPATGIRASLAVPSGRLAKSVTLLSPDEDSDRPLPFSMEDGRVRFRVPRLTKYALAVLELDERSR